MSAEFRTTPCGDLLCSWGAAGASCRGGRAAGSGSHGRIRAGAAPRGVLDGWGGYAEGVGGGGGSKRRRRRRRSRMMLRCGRNSAPFTPLPGTRKRRRRSEGGKKRKKKKLPKTFARAPLRRRQAQMLGIMAGLDQMDRYVVLWRRFSSTTALVCTWLVFLVTLHLALCSCVVVWPKMLFFVGDYVICFRIQLFLSGSTVDTYVCQSTEACFFTLCVKVDSALSRWLSDEFHTLSL